MDKDTRTPEEIQRDIEVERAELSNTLNSLNDNLSCENISASIGEQVRDMGSDVMNDLTGTIVDRARQQPLAAGLVLAGLAWMTLGTPGRSEATSQRREPSSRTPAQDTPSQQSDHSLTSHQSMPRFESTRTEGDAKLDRLAQDTKSLRERMAEGTETLSEEARARVLQAREAAAEAAETAVEAARAGAQKTKDVVQDNPLVVGGIALAVGATLGGIMLLRKQNADAREARNELFREADRVFRDELARSSTSIRSGERV